VDRISGERCADGSSAIMTTISVSFITFAGVSSWTGNFLALPERHDAGVIGAACHHYEMSQALWSFVAPHGR